MIVSLDIMFAIKILISSHSLGRKISHSNYFFLTFMSVAYYQLCWQYLSPRSNCNSIEKCDIVVDANHFIFFSYISNWMKKFLVDIFEFSVDWISEIENNSFLFFFLSSLKIWCSVSNTAENDEFCCCNNVENRMRLFYNV